MSTTIKTRVIGIDIGVEKVTIAVVDIRGTIIAKEFLNTKDYPLLNNFIEVMQTIWQEIEEVRNGTADKTDNVLLNAPHPEYEVVANEWNHSYSREKAAYPIESVKENKFWINVARVNDTLGDRKLLSTRYQSFED